MARHCITADGYARAVTQTELWGLRCCILVGSRDAAYCSIAASLQPVKGDRNEKGRIQKELAEIGQDPAGNHRNSARLRNKYKFDESTGRIKLSKLLPEGMIFPFDFGFLPGTKSDDGDPLDVLLLSDEPTFPGCQVDARLIGVIKASQKEQGKTNRNDRLIAAAEASVLYAGVKELSDLEPSVLKQIEAFFVNYQKVRNIEFRVLAREGAQKAAALVEGVSNKKAA